MAKIFLQAEWRKLAMANYAVDKKLLEPFLPCYTEIDLWKDTCYVSLVGFMFLDTRLKGFAIPFHRNFEEVNLRFYVRHKENGEWKRGVVFIKEIVPRPALTLAANAIYNEKYETMPMGHTWEIAVGNLTVEYRWKKKEWNIFRIKAERKSVEISPGAEEEFITEHYWGYTKINDAKTSEYKVDHPRWEVYPIKDYSINVEFGAVYGPAFAFLKNETPKSVFLAEGSEIKVLSGRIL